MVFSYRGLVFTAAPKYLQFALNSAPRHDHSNDLVIANETELLIMIAVERMPAQRRKIFTMIRFEGLSNDEIASQLNRTLIDHIATTQAVMNSVERSEPVPEEVQQKYDAITDPAFREAVALKEEVLRKNMEAALAKGGYVIRDIPEVADEEMFDAIAARYAGKVAVIDFWATWCGPCRASMANHEPHKDTYLGKDVVFVYLTGPSSPETTWRIMIADAKGEHYRLSESQWNAVCDKFDVRGIPSWVVVTKKGEYLKEELYSADKWESVINRELAK